MPMTDEAPQTVARLLRWDGQPGPALRMAEPRPEDEDLDEEDLDDEDIEEDGDLDEEDEAS
jgi:hypothetical protein